MRKIFVLLCVMVCAMTASAQLVTSRSKMVTSVAEPEPPSEDRIDWVVRLGVGSNNFVGDSYDDSKSRFGYLLTIEFNRKIANAGAYWGMDFGMGSRGYRYDEKGYESKSIAHNFQYSPFIFGWKIKIADSKFAIDPHIGFFLSGDYTGKYKAEGSGWESESSMSDWLDNDYIPVDAGLRIGCGVWYANRFNLDMTYSRGFVPEFTDNEGGSSNFYVRFGVAF